MVGAMNFRSTMFLVSVLSVFAGCGPSVDYYVSPAGSDAAGDGSAANPWRTIPFALDHIDYSTGGIHKLHVAAGTYDGKVSIHNPIEILGAGPEHVTLQNTADNDYVLSIDRGLVVLRGFKVDGRNAANPGIRAVACLPTLENVVVHRPGGFGIVLTNCRAFTVTNCTVTTEGLIFADIGIDVDGESASARSVGTITGFAAGDHIDHVINIGLHCDVTIRDSTLTGSPIYYADGVRIQAASTVTIVNCVINRPPGGEPASTGTPHNPPYAGIEVATASNENALVRVENCTIGGWDVGIGINMMHNRLLVQGCAISGNLSAGVWSVFNGSSPAQYPTVDLGGGSPGSTGGNTFGTAEAWAVDHGAPYGVSALSNNWSVSPAAVPARIRDHADDPARGTVDY